MSLALLPRMGLELKPRPVRYESPADPPAGDFFVAPEGDDGAPGTIAEPFRTIGRGSEALSPGETLIVRAGTYAETPVITNSGAPGSPITLQAEPGAIVADGLAPAFELVDGAIDLYRSTTALAAGDGDWSGHIRLDGKHFALVPYQSYAALVATTQAYVAGGDYYMGPGFLYQSADSRLYVRLTPPDPAAIHGRVFMGPASLDPNDNELTFGHSAYGFHFDGCAHVVVDGFAVNNHRRSFYVASGHDITIRNCQVRTGKNGFLFDTGVSDVTFTRNTIVCGVPPWIGWRDVKGEEQAGAGLKMALGIVQDCQDITISDCLAVDAFDGITATGEDGSGPSGLIVTHCEFNRVYDDSLQLSSSADACEFSWNLCIGPGPGYQGTGTGATIPDSNFWHHNIIDCTREELYKRAGNPDDGPDWRFHAPMVTHNGSGFVGDVARKIYNNTIIFRDNKSNYGAGTHRPPQDLRTGSVHEVYNNIIVVLDDFKASRYVVFDDGMERVDGNLYFRPVQTGEDDLFRLWEDTSGDTFSYATLADWLASPEFVISQSHYPPGFEASGIELDPRIADLASLDFRPLASEAATAGVDLTGSGWPDAYACDFRGAVEPGLGTPTGGVGVRPNT